ncbi:MAG: gliding motility-associated C-terminal domain-containing protein [Flavobacteriales bacterium]
MKFIYTILSICLGMTSLSQSISDCNGAIVLCDDVYSEESASFTTGDVFEFTGTCNNFLEQSSVWYTFTVQQDGVLAFTLTPNNANDDYDWGLFDITENGCAGIGSTSPEVSCNSWGVVGVNGATGISTAQGGIANTAGPGNFNGPPFNADLPVTAGQTYALVVMNWSNSLEGYTIDFGESTASLYDDVPPVPQEVDISCSNSTITLTFSEPIVGESVQSLDFEIIDPNGALLDVTNAITFGGSLQNEQIVIDLGESLQLEGTYTINITDDTGLVEDACGNLGSGSVTFDVVNLITYDILVENACNGVGGQIEVVELTGGISPFTYTINGIAQTSPVFSNLNSGNYTVAVEQGNGCVIEQLAEVPNSLIDVAIPLQDSISCSTPRIVIENVEVTGDEPFNYDWQSVLGTGISSGSNTIAPEINQPGFYELTVTNGDGCSDQASVEIAEGEFSSIDLNFLIFPTILTTNNDGKNETWYPYLLNDPTLDVFEVLSQYEAKVYNRWGTLVFESSDSKQKFEAGDLENGVYFVHVIYATDCGNGDSRVYEGTIQVTQ